MIVEDQFHFNYDGLQHWKACMGSPKCLLDGSLCQSNQSFLEPSKPWCLLENKFPRAVWISPELSSSFSSSAAVSKVEALSEIMSSGSDRRSTNWQKSSMKVAVHMSVTTSRYTALLVAHVS